MNIILELAVTAIVGTAFVNLTRMALAERAHRRYLGRWMRG